MITPDENEDYELSAIDLEILHKAKENGFKLEEKKIGDHSFSLSLPANVWAFAHDLLRRHLSEEKQLRAENDALRDALKPFAAAQEDDPVYLIRAIGLEEKIGICPIIWIDSTQEECAAKANHSQRILYSRPQSDELSRSTVPVDLAYLNALEDDAKESDELRKAAGIVLSWLDNPRVVQMSNEALAILLRAALVKNAPPSR